MSGGLRTAGKTTCPILNCKGSKGCNAQGCPMNVFGDVGPQSLHQLPNQLANGNSPVSPDGFEAIDCGGCAPPVLVPAGTSPPAGSGAAIAQTGGPAPVSNASFHGSVNTQVEGRNNV